MTHTKPRFWLSVFVTIVLLSAFAPPTHAAAFRDELDAVTTYWSTVLSPAASFGVIIGMIIDFLYVLAFSLCTLFILLGGVLYILSAGDDSKAALAKKMILYAILGLFVVLGFRVIRDAVVNIYRAAGSEYAEMAAQPFIILITRIGFFFAAIVAITCTVAIIFGGIMYALAAGDEQRAARAKKIILFAIIGLIIAINAGVLTGLVRDVAGDPEGPGVGADPLISLIGRIGIVILAPLALIATAAVIYGGYIYITSGGEEDKARRGKQTITYALIGIFIVLISALIVNLIISL